MSAGTRVLTRQTHLRFPQARGQSCAQPAARRLRTRRGEREGAETGQVRGFEKRVFFSRNRTKPATAGGRLREERLCAIIGTCSVECNCNKVECGLHKKDKRPNCALDNGSGNVLSRRAAPHGLFCSQPHWSSEACPQNLRAGPIRGGHPTPMGGGGPILGGSGPMPGEGPMPGSGPIIGGGVGICRPPIIGEFEMRVPLPTTCEPGGKFLRMC